MKADNFLSPQLKEDPGVNTGNPYEDAYYDNFNSSDYDNIPETSTTTTPGFDYLGLIQTLVQSGATIGAAVIQANAHTGHNFNTGQIPQYILNPGSGNNQNSSNGGNTKTTTPAKPGTILGMSTEVFVILCIGIVLVGGFAVYYFITKK